MAYTFRTRILNALLQISDVCLLTNLEFMQSCHVWCYPQQSSILYIPKIRQPTMVYNPRIRQSSILYIPKIRQPTMVYHSRIRQSSILYISRIEQPTIVYNPRINQPSILYNPRIRQPTIATPGLSSQCTIQPQD